ncbi:lonely Cys domain-containing protein [Streptomyces mirabilis]|uniref:lonely Cys domain-containing protein n=1 Tax=Streptomyces mirabilis TaxID=68239 RepID=UPI0036BD61AF
MDRLADQDGRPLGIRDPEAMQRYVLRLDDSEPLPDSDSALSRLVDAAAAAGRAGSAQQLRDYYAEQTLLSGESYAADAHGNPGRDWAAPGGTGQGLWTQEVMAPDLHNPWNPVMDTRQAAPWHELGAVPYSVRARYAPGPRMVLARDRVSGRWLGFSHEEFARLVASDPALEGATRIVLAVGYMGDGDLELPRLVARRTGRDVWAYTEDLSFITPENTDVLVMRPHEYGRRGNSPGVWVRSGPGDLPTTYTSREPGEETYRSFPLVDRSGNPFGRGFHDERDRALREVFMPLMAEAKRYRLSNRQDDSDDPPPPDEPTRDVPWPTDTDASRYWISLHGNHEHFMVTARDGSRIELTARQLAGTLRKRPSFTRPRPAPVPGRPAPKRVIVAASCEIGEVPGGTNRLFHDSLGQRLANEVGDLFDAVYAPNDVFASYSWNKHEPFAVRGGDRARMVEFRPLPTPARLEELATQAGMKWPESGAGPPSGQWRQDTTRALVRFLRDVFTVKVEDRADYLTLLKGAWALERMRLNDPRQRAQLLSFADLEETRECARGAWRKGPTGTDHTREYWDLLHKADAYLQDPSHQDITLSTFGGLLLDELISSVAPEPDPPLPVDPIRTKTTASVPSTLPAHTQVLESPAHPASSDGPTNITPSTSHRPEPAPLPGRSTAGAARPDAHAARGPQRFEVDGPRSEASAPLTSRALKEMADAVVAQVASRGGRFPDERVSGDGGVQPGVVTRFGRTFAGDQAGPVLPRGHDPEWFELVSPGASALDHGVDWTRLSDRVVTFENHEEAVEWGRAHWGDLSHLSREVRHAVWAYTTDADGDAATKFKLPYDAGFRPVNGLLRKRFKAAMEDSHESIQPNWVYPVEVSEDGAAPSTVLMLGSDYLHRAERYAWQRVADLETALLGQRTPKPVVVLRTVGRERFPNSSPPYLTGRVFEELGFVSVSLNPEFAAGADHSDYVLHLFVPEGTSAVYVGGVAHYGHSEAELILGRDRRWQVLHVERDDHGVWHLFGRVLHSQVGFMPRHAAHGRLPVASLAAGGVSDSRDRIIVTAADVRREPVYAGGRRVGVVFLDGPDHREVAAAYELLADATAVTHVGVEGDGDPWYRVLGHEDVPLPTGGDRFVIDALGAPDGPQVRLTDGRLAVAEVDLLAAVLEEDERYRVLSSAAHLLWLTCWSATGAQQLANRTGHTVWAPDSRLDTVPGISSATSSPLVLLQEGGRRGTLRRYTPDPSWQHPASPAPKPLTDSPGVATSPLRLRGGSRLAALVSRPFPSGPPQAPTALLGELRLSAAGPERQRPGGTGGREVSTFATGGGRSFFSFGTGGNSHRGGSLPPSAPGAPDSATTRPGQPSPTADEAARPLRLRGGSSSGRGDGPSLRGVMDRLRISGSGRPAAGSSGGRDTGTPAPGRSPAFPEGYWGVGGAGRGVAGEGVGSLAGGSGHPVSGGRRSASPAQGRGGAAPGGRPGAGGTPTRYLRMPSPAPTTRVPVSPDDSRRGAVPVPSSLPGSAVRGMSRDSRRATPSAGRTPGLRAASPAPAGPPGLRAPSPAPGGFSRGGTTTVPVVRTLATATPLTGSLPSTFIRDSGGTGTAPGTAGPLPRPGTRAGVAPGVGVRAVGETGLRRSATPDTSRRPVFPGGYGAGSGRDSFVPGPSVSGGTSGRSSVGRRAPSPVSAVGRATVPDTRAPSAGPSRPPAPATREVARPISSRGGTTGRQAPGPRRGTFDQDYRDVAESGEFILHTEARSRWNVWGTRLNERPEDGVFAAEIPGLGLRGWYETGGTPDGIHFADSSGRLYNRGPHWVWYRPSGGPVSVSEFRVESLLDGVPGSSTRPFPEFPAAAMSIANVPDELLNSIVWRTDDDPLYRFTYLSVEEIFRDGLLPLGDNPVSLLNYVYDYPTDSAWVSTTRNPNYVRDSARNNPTRAPALYARYQRRVDVQLPGGALVNETLGIASPFPDQQEVAFLGGIRPEYIVGVQEYASGRPLNRYTPNPGFNPSR